MTINDALAIISLVIFVAPIVLALVKYIGQLTHNKKMENLAGRAEIIVRSLTHEGLESDELTNQGLQRLSEYAGEVGIKVNATQALDYIQAARHLVEKVEARDV